MSEKYKLGRPFAGDAKPELVKVTFRLDADTMAKLEALETRTGRTKVGRQRSELLRKLICEAFDRESD
jgi:hypothetical protein